MFMSLGTSKFEIFRSISCYRLVFLDSSNSPDFFLNIRWHTTARLQSDVRPLMLALLDQTRLLITLQQSSRSVSCTVERNPGVFSQGRHVTDVTEVDFVSLKLTHKGKMVTYQSGPTALLMWCDQDGSDRDWHFPLRSNLHWLVVLFSKVWKFPCNQSYIKVLFYVSDGRGCAKSHQAPMKNFHFLPKFSCNRFN